MAIVPTPSSFEQFSYVPRQQFNVDAALQFLNDVKGLQQQQAKLDLEKRRMEADIALQMQDQQLSAGRLAVAEQQALTAEQQARTGAIQEGRLQEQMRAETGFLGEKGPMARGLSLLRSYSQSRGEFAAIQRGEETTRIRLRELEETIRTNRLKEEESAIESTAERKQRALDNLKALRAAVAERTGSDAPLVQIMDAIRSQGIGAGSEAKLFLENFKEGDPIREIAARALEEAMEAFGIDPKKANPKREEAIKEILGERKR